MDYSTPTKPTLASRLPALKSRGSCRGFAVYQDRVVVTESHLELVVFYIFASRPDVESIIPQPAPAIYVDESGRQQKHTFDFEVIFRDGKRHFIAVKPAAKVEKSAIKKTLRLLREQIMIGPADEIRLVTDAHLSLADRFNAQQAFECWRFPIEEHDAIIKHLADKLTGSTRIADLASMSGIRNGMAFRAIIRLITRHILAIDNPGSRITPDSYVFCCRGVQ